MDWPCADVWAVPGQGEQGTFPALVGRTNFMGWDLEISGSLLFQPSDLALMFKYMCVLL